MRYFTLLRTVIIFVAVLLSACGTALPTVKPYKLDVQQGNVVTSKMLLQLRPGMTKSQVRFIMGTPLIQDSFHGNRWDYAYQMREAGKITEQRRVILDFENELLKTVRGDVISAEKNQTKLDESKSLSGTRVIAPNKKVEEKSLLSKLKFWGGSEADNAPNPNADSSTKTSKTVEAKKPEAILPALPTPAVELANATTEQKPIMAVPLALPAIAETTTPQPIAPAPSPVLETPVADTPKSLPVSEPNSVPATNTQTKVEDDNPVTPKTPNYQSPAGMIFDRTLRSYVPDAPSLPTPLDQSPRAGNKTIPAPKDLPAENDPSFFDRMLEKIGF